jgi:outer membrane protein assembly factor BamA
MGRFLQTAMVFVLSATLSAQAFGFAVNISGNTRTKSYYIERIVSDCFEILDIEAKDVALATDSIRQCVLNSRLFSEVDVKFDEGALKVDVKDKWTLIPIPIVSAGSGNSKSTGLFMLESNLLGMGLNLAVGGTSSNRGTSYFGFLTDRSLFFTPWNYSLAVTKSDQEVLLKDKDLIMDGFLEDTLSYKGSLGYRFGQLNISAIVSLRLSQYQEYPGFAKPDDNRAEAVGLSLNYDNRNYQLYFSEGLGLSINYQADIQRSDGEAHSKQLTGIVNWQKAVFTDQVVQLGLSHGSREGGTRANAFRIGGSNGFRGIELTTEWADHYDAGSFDYQIPLHSFDSGTLTFAPFLDIGRIYEAGEPTASNYRSTGLGIYYYLKAIALPGVGFQAGYNDKFQGKFFSAFFGLTR